MHYFLENSEEVFPPYDDEAYWEYLMDEAVYYAGKGDLQGSFLHNIQMMDCDAMIKIND